MKRQKELPYNHSTRHIRAAGNSCDRAKVRKWGDLPVADSEAAFPVCEGSGEKAKIAGVQDADLLSFRCAGGGECGWLFGNFNARICKIVVFFSDGQC